MKVIFSSMETNALAAVPTAVDRSTILTEELNASNAQKINSSIRLIKSADAKMALP